VLTEVLSDFPDWKNVVEVIHGHSFCGKYFGNRSPQVNRSTFNSIVVDMLEKIENEVATVLSISLNL